MVEKITIITLSILILIICLIAVHLSDLLLQSHLKLDIHKDLLRVATKNFASNYYTAPPKVNKLEYRADVRISREFIERDNFPEDHIERQLAEQIIKKLPREDLISLFNIEHLNPKEDINPNWPMSKINKILELRQHQQHEYRATFFIDKP